MQHIILHRLLLSPLVLVVLIACSTTSTATTPTTPAPSDVTQVTVATMTVPSAASPTMPPITPVSPTLVPTTAPGERQPTALLATTIPVANWMRQHFANAWDIEYPEGWTVNDAGLHEGHLVLSGTYRGHIYEVGLGYPIFEHPDAAQNLDAWIDAELASLAPDQRRAVQILDITVAGTPAKKVLNMPEKIFDDGVTRRYAERLTHACYIWQRNDQSPSVVSIKLMDTQPFDARQMEAVLDRFLAGIR